MTAVGRPVVVGVDQSAEGAAALRLALTEAALRGLPLVGLRVWPDAIRAGYPMAALLPYSADQADQDAHEVVEEMLKQAREQVPGADGVDVELRALRGAPGPVLVAAADAAALLVVGTRSAGPLSRALLGSVSRHAVHHAPCPVAVVPAPSTAGGEPSRVLVGVDRCPPSHAALSWAADAAARRGAVLVPVLVRDTTWAGDDESPALVGLEANECRWLQEAVPAQPGLVVEPQVLSGPAGHALATAARPQDLLVVGTRGRGAAAGAVLGSTSNHVVRHAGCPVVVVRTHAVRT